MQPVKMPNQREELFLRMLVSGEKYGRQLRDEYEKRTRQSMPLGSLYVTLDRMEEKGFVRSSMGESAAERGGNRRKYFKITADGMSSLRRVELSFGGMITNA